MTQMITKEEVMPLLLGACSSFSETWEERRVTSASRESLDIQLGEFAHHLVELVKADRIHELAAVFEIIERLYLEGDDDVREIVTPEILIGIQNAGAELALDSRRFVKYLKPETVKLWQRLNEI